MRTNKNISWNLFQMIYSNSPQQVGAEIEMNYEQQSYPRTQPSAIMNIPPSTTITENCWTVFNSAEETSKQISQPANIEFASYLDGYPTGDQPRISRLGLKVLQNQKIPFPGFFTFWLNAVITQERQTYPPQPYVQRDTSNQKTIMNSPIHTFDKPRPGTHMVKSDQQSILKDYTTGSIQTARCASHQYVAHRSLKDIENFSQHNPMSRTQMERTDTHSTFCSSKFDGTAKNLSRASTPYPTRSTRVDQQEARKSRVTYPR